MEITEEEIQEEPVVPFYIPATTSILELRSRILKHDDTFAMLNQYGDIGGERGNPEGLYHRDTRFLSAFTLTISGQRPMLLSSNLQSGDTMLSVDLTNPDFVENELVILPRDTIHLLRSKFLWDGACYERIGVYNYDVHPHRVTIGMNFVCDFADLFEVRGQIRKARGKLRISTEKARIRYIYMGLDGITRTTAFHFDPVPSTLDRRTAQFFLELMPKQRISLFSTICCIEREETVAQPRRFSNALRASRARLHSATSRITRIETSNDIFNEMITRASEDLAMLITRTQQGFYPYAGIPWFSAPFGRDAMIAAMQMLWADSGLAADVLVFLAHWQAKALIMEADAEPGKILHEMRFGEMARLKEIPFELYYGSVDSTPLFIILAGMYYERTGDLAVITNLWPHIEAALRWMDEYGDADGDGFIEYGQQQSEGLSNQGWKDSHDAIFHADGTMARRPIALCEVQGYAYAALRSAAKLALALGLQPMHQALEAKATVLKARFHEAFWCEDIGTYALALDGEKNPCRVRTSNAGQLLFTGILDRAYAEKIISQLLAEEFFTGWGVRTVAARESRYNPMSYHNGSVWPHDNALIALGMARYGFNSGAQRILAGLFDAAIRMDLRRLPELFCGFHRRPGRRPTLYPVACIPQAWASATPYCLLQACLGISFDPQVEEVRFSHPVLPDFIDEIILSGLKIGKSSLDVRLQRHKTEVTASVLRRSGKGRAVVTL